MPEKPKRFKLEPKQLRIYGIGGALIGIYLAHFLNLATGTNVFSFIGSLAAIGGVLWGANAIRRICSYGLGTGVPAMGMLALGMATVASLFGLNIAEQFGIGILGPIIALGYSVLFGYIIGILCNKVMHFNIPIMEEGMLDISGAGTLAILGWSMTLSGTISYNMIVKDVYSTGFLAIIFILGGMAIFHPFNANLGPDEKQDRTLVDGLMVSGVAMVALGICSLATLGLSAALVTIVVGFAVWYYNYIWYFRLASEDAAAVVGTGLLPPSVQ
jgi:tetrahydromethanopterin S-methyltransferase subunit C